MEEDNPWLDPESVKHINKKSVKPEYKKPEEKNKEEKVENKEEKVLNKDKEEKVLNKKEERKISEKDKIDLEKVPHGLVSVSTILKTDEKIAKFLDVLLSEFTTELPETSKNWVIQNFGEDWLRVFLKDVEYLQSDLKTSKFFPSQDKMIFLKYIFLLQQSL